MQIDSAYEIKCNNQTILIYKYSGMYYMKNMDVGPESAGGKYTTIYRDGVVITPPVGHAVELGASIDTIKCGNNILSSIQYQGRVLNSSTFDTDGKYIMSKHKVYNANMELVATLADSTDKNCKLTKLDFGYADTRSGGPSRNIYTTDFYDENWNKLSTISRYSMDEIAPGHVSISNGAFYNYRKSTYHDIVVVKRYRREEIIAVSNSGSSSIVYKLRDIVYSDFECAVCGSNMINRCALIPCGHTKMCTDCASSSQYCCACSETIKAVLKLNV